MEGKGNNITKVAYKAINGRFSIGNYLGIEVVIMNENGYVHGASLVAQAKTRNGQPKQFKHWRSLKEAKDFIDYLSAVIPTLDLIIDITDAPVNYRGAYIHPRLVPQVAQWASPEFADKVSIVINELAVKTALKKKKQVIAEQKAKLAEKDDSIAQLRQELAEQKSMIEKILGHTTEMRETLNVAVEEFVDVHTEITAANEVLVDMAASQASTEVKVDLITEKLGIAVERRVPPDPVRNRNEVFCVMRIPRTQHYKVFRCQHRNALIAKSRLEIEGYTSCVYYKEDPNAVNIWNRVKESIPADIGVVSHATRITAPSRVKLLKFIHTVESEKLEV